MFERLISLLPIRRPDTETAVLLTVKKEQLNQLLRLAVRESVIRQLPASVSMLRYGEPELALLALLQRDKTKPGPDSLPAIGSEVLKKMAIALTDAARILKFFPEKNLYKAISSGGVAFNPVILEKPNENDLQATRDYLEQKAISESRIPPIHDTIRAMGAKSNVLANVRLMQTEQPYLEALAYSIGRRPDVSKSVATDADTIFQLMSALITEIDTITTPDEAVTRYLLALGYLHLHQHEGDLRYTGDFSSVAFVRFMAIRMRDYAKFFSSVRAITELMHITSLTSTAEALLALVGGQDAATSQLKLQQEDFNRSHSSARLRIAGVLRPWVESVFSALATAAEVKHLIVDEVVAGLPDLIKIEVYRVIAMPARMHHMSTMVSQTDLVLGPPAEQHYLSEKSVSAILSAAVFLYKDAYNRTLSLERDLPPLEEATQLLQDLPLLSISIPSLLKPRLTSLGDDSTVGVGIRASEIQADGQITETLTPYLLHPLNYTSLEREIYTRQPNQVLRVRGRVYAEVGLPASLLRLPIPTNYLEGERPTSIVPTIYDLSPDEGGARDILRTLQAFLGGLNSYERAFSISQLAGAYLIAVKDPTPYMEPSLVDALPMRTAAGNYSVLVPTGDEQLTFGMSTRELIMANIAEIERDSVRPGDDESYKRYRYYPIQHPGGEVDLFLYPLALIPTIRDRAFTYKYVRASDDALVPMTALQRSSSLERGAKVPLEAAIFSRHFSHGHAQGWDSVRRWPKLGGRIRVGDDGRVYTWEDHLAGYLDPKTAFADPSPWKTEAATPPADRTPVVERPIAAPTMSQEAPISVPTAIQPATPPEGDAMKDV